MPKRYVDSGDSLLERFWDNVDQTGGPDACHPWTGPIRNQKGYGKFRVNGRDYVAHRWILGHLRGKSLKWPGEVGRHACDNPPCCNLRHLCISTHQENVIDAIERSGHPASKKYQTHCKHRHEFTDENTFYSSGRRYCLTCHRTRARINARVYRARKRQLKENNG